MAPCIILWSKGGGTPKMEILGQYAPQKLSMEVRV